tara:strand:- start:947 stop:2146 length:1200 start_codon:yes stop_codon:yes gene_type:complete
MIDWAERFAPRIPRMIASDVRELVKALREPDVISFGGGIPDPDLFPREVIAEAHNRILGDPKTARIALQYSDTAGYLPLREWLASYMGTLGAPCTPDNFLITSGSQQGLDFLARLFLAPHDLVLLEMPTYIGALRAFDGSEARYEVFPESADARSSTESARFGYLLPDFQNPKGTSLTLSQRTAALETATTLDIPLIEDSAYEKLRFDGESLPPLLALEISRMGGIDKGRVIYTGTFSKTIVPALRIGWIAAPRPVIEKLNLIKQASDLHTSTLSQMVMCEVAPHLLNDQHLARMRNTYRQRRDATLAGLEKYMPAGTHWTRPEGGMYLWITLPQKLDGTVVAQRALREARVAVIAGRSCFAADPVPNTLRLSFSLITEDKAMEGLRRLGELLSRIIAE